MANEHEGDGDDEDVSGEARGVDPGRLVLEEEETVVRKMLDPRLPSEEEVERHNLTHLPHRNWCPICVKAKGKDMDHRSAVDRERTVSEYCFDYCFPGDELGFKLTVFVGKETGFRVRLG